MTHSFVRVPPDSTGKKIATVHRSELYYDARSGEIHIGSVLTGQISSAQGTITGHYADTPTTGVLYLTSVSGNFSDNENLQIDAITVAVADGVLSDFEVQQVILVDPDNPLQRQRIDEYGATVNTFTDGAPVFGPFGSMSVGERQIIKSYRFAYHGHNDDFNDVVANGGAVNYDAQSGVIVLSTTTANGSKASRRSHFYHPYFPTIGNEFMMSVQAGDSGKPNLRRRFGLFDDNNGFYFQFLDNVLSVVLRSNATGVVLEDDKPIAQFSNDRLDGTGLTNFRLDNDAPQVVWCDFQWLGSGRVRFGFLEPNGNRIVAHTFRHANTAILAPYMRTATLPISIEQENIGSVASSSEFRWTAGAVAHLTAAEMTGSVDAGDGNNQSLVTITDADGEVPILSGRPALTINGVTNRALIRLRSVSYLNNHDSTAAVIFRVRRTVAALMTGENFVSAGTLSALEIDKSATAITPIGASVDNQYVTKGEVYRAQVNGNAKLHKYELYMHGDGATQPVLTWTAQVVGTGSAKVGVAANWEEILQ